VGLGNPGREHTDTRHNVGFMVADRLAERWSLGRPKDRFRGRLAEGRARLAAPGANDAGADQSGSAAESLQASYEQGAQAPRVAVLWPLTFMNDVGRSVGPARGSLKVALEHVLVVHDEIDLPFGEVRTRLGGGLAGHNGLKSLKRELGNAEFARVRVGVGRPKSTDPEIVSAYVLGRFRESSGEVDELIDRACEAVERVLLDEGV
jgi:PTH1 family peptidyl-tRNA hydrolase